MQNNTNYPIIRTFVLALFLFITSCTKTATTSDDTPQPIPPVGNSEIKLTINNSDFIFIKTPVSSGHLWVLKTELSRVQYSAICNQYVPPSDSTYQPQVLNWYDAARFCNKFSKLIDSAAEKQDSTNYDSLFAPVYTDTTSKETVSATSIKSAGYVAAFSTLPDTLKKLSIIFIKRDSLIQRVALLDSFTLTRADTSAIRTALFSSPDSVYIKDSSSVLLSLRKHIKYVQGSAKIDTALLDTIIRKLNSSTKNPFVFKSYRHILTTRTGTDVAAPLPGNSIKQAVIDTSSWKVAYFTSIPADTLIKNLFPILMPSPCTVTVNDPPDTIRIWNVNQTVSGAVRLPTSYEWEQAAVCGTHSLLYSTNTGKLNLASAVYGKTSPMETSGNALRTANPYGLIDMTGNLYEWVDNWVYKPYKGLKGGYFGSAASDSTLLNLFTSSGIPYTTYAGKTGFRPIIVGSPSVDSLLNLLKK